MANSWFRIWHDMPNDPKWRTIARHSKQPISLVISTYVHILANVSANATERGRTHGLDSEDLASALDVQPDQIEAILGAMQGRVMDGERVTGWEKRQPMREDNSAERSKAWREKQKAENDSERNRTQQNAEKRPDTDSDTEEKNPLTPLSTAVDEIDHKGEAKAKRQTAEAFERFWAAWPKSPRKIGKADCINRWKRQCLDAKADDIIAHVQAMSMCQQWREGFEPKPATYLNQRRWEDGVPADRPAQQPGQTQHEGDWWGSASEIERRADDAGVKRKQGEEFQWFKCRVAKACKERRWMDLILADLLRTKSSHYARVYEYFNGTPPMEGI